MAQPEGAVLCAATIVGTLGRAQQQFGPQADAFPQRLLAEEEVV
jgi:hypothetical protein